MPEGGYLTQEDLEEVLRSLAERLNAPEGEGSFAANLFQPVRPQHFLFAHQYMADRLEWESDNALEDLLLSATATERLRELWLSFGAQAKAEEDALIPADGLECFPFHPNGKHRGVIVRFPEPEHTGEAYFAAAVFSSDPRVRDFACYYRFFLLELGWDFDGSKRAFLCERAYGRHYNYGDGGEPRREAFAELVASRFFGPGTFAPELDPSL